MTTRNVSNEVLSRKVAHVLKNVRIEGELVLALDALSEFYTENSKEDRKMLRKLIVEKSMRAEKAYLKELEVVEREIEEFIKVVEQINVNCKKAEAILAEATKGSVELMEKMNFLSLQRNEILAKEKEIKEFLAAFQLTAQEELVFERDLKVDGVSREFFGVMKKIQEIRENCKVQLEKQQQKAILEVMDKMAEMHERGLEKLWRWCNRIIKVVNLDSEDPRLPNNEPFSITWLCDAFEVLKQRPAYMNSCLGELANQRKDALVRQFSIALTSEFGHFGSARPIEMSAHDPHRFISDMLAWMHQSLATECELLKSLLKFKSFKPLAEPESKDSESNNVYQVAIHTHLEKAFEGLLRPLQIRIDQVFEANRPSSAKLGDMEYQPLGFVGAYQIFNVFQFYRKMIRPFFGEHSLLLEMLSKMASDSMKLCYDLIQAAGASLTVLATEKQNLPRKDLIPSISFAHFISELAMLLQVHETALVQLIDADDSAMNAMMSDPNLLISAVYEPITKTVEMICNACNFDVSESAVFYINILVQFQQALRSFSFTQSRLEILSLDIYSQLHKFVEHQTNEILKRSGISTQFLALCTPDHIAELRSITPDSLKSTFQQFYTSLIGSSSQTTLKDALFISDRLQTPQLRTESRAGISQGLVSSYSKLHASLQSAHPETCSSFLSYSPEVFATLLEI